MRWRTKQQSKHLVLQERNAHAGTPSHWPQKCPKCGESPPARRIARVFPAAHTQQAKDCYPLAGCPRLPTRLGGFSRSLGARNQVPSAQGSCWPCWVVGVGARAQPGYGFWVLGYRALTPCHHGGVQPRIHRQGGALAASSGPTLGFLERQRQRQATGG